MPEHPNEPLLEAILVNQDKNSKDHIQMLEHLLVQADNNKLDPLLEAQLVVTDKIGKDIVQAIKDIPKSEIPEPKEVDFKETNKLLRELTDEVKKKEEYEIQIDSNLKEKLKGDKGENGKDGVNGKDGKDGKNGLDGLDGKDGKDGFQGPQGIPGKSLTQEDIDRISKGLSKTKKENFLFANSGVNSVIAGSNITIDNSNPQHPIISSIGGGSGGGQVNTIVAGTGVSIDSTDPINPVITNSLPDQVVSITGAGTSVVTGTYPNFTVTSTGGTGGGDVVGPASAINNNFPAFDLTTGKLIKDSGSNASSFATSVQGTLAGTALQPSAIGVSVLAQRTFGTAANNNTGDFATSIQGTKADNAVVANVAIVAGTGTKVSYDTKGLVTSSTSATTADIADSLNKRYVTDANLTTIGNQSGTNTGDETTATIKTKLGITTLSGSNTGDQTSIVGITGTIAQFNTAITDGDLATGGGTATGTNTGDNAVNTLYSGLATSKQDTITLTTTGTSGAATLVGATLNIPQYSSGGGSGTPATTVVSETTAGLTPVVGVSTNYAREDHSHGTPSAGAGSGVSFGLAYATNAGYAMP